MKLTRQAIGMASLLGNVLSVVYIFLYVLALSSIELLTYTMVYTSLLYCVAIPVFLFALGLLLAARGIMSVSANTSVTQILRTCCLLFYVLMVAVILFQSAVASSFLYFTAQSIAPTVFLLTGLLEGSHIDEKSSK